VLQRCIRAQTELSAEAIAQWPGVRSAQRDGAVLEIQAEPAEPVVARLLQADPQLHDLEVRRAGLADAFLAITDSQEAA
jgi:ABC-2 type transport system ATP-binding protein